MGWFLLAPGTRLPEALEQIDDTCHNAQSLFAPFAANLLFFPEGLRQ
jgi:hypothetical protein